MGWFVYKKKVEMLGIADQHSKEVCKNTRILWCSKLQKQLPELSPDLRGKMHVYCMPMLPPSCYQNMSVYMSMNNEVVSLSRLQLNMPFIVVKVSKSSRSVHVMHSI